MSTWTRRTSSAPLVGRDDELRHLVEVARPHAEHLSVVLVSGPAGIGKSRLVSEAARTLGKAGTRVLIGSCLGLGESAPPYEPLVAAFRRASVPECTEALALMTGATQATRARLFDRVRSALAALAATRPTVLVVEDLHWADHATRDMLVYLASAGPAGRWSLVLTYREEELARHPGSQRVVSTIAREPVHHLELEPLSVEAVAELVTHLQGRPTPPDDAVRIHRRTGGVPLYVEEVVAAEAGGVEGVPPHLRATFLDRVADLPGHVRDVVAVAAVAGTGCDPSLVASVLGRPVPDVGHALDRAVSAGVLEPQPQGYRVRHELLREAVYDDVPLAQRRDLHRRLAEALAVRDDTDRALVAHHWDAAGDDARAAGAYLVAAAVAERLHSPGSVHAHLEEVIARWDRLPAETRSAVGSKASLLTRAAEAAALAGSSRAVPLGEQRRALALGDPVELAAACERLARYRWTSGDGAGAHRTFREALRALTADTPDDVRARVLAGDAWILAMSFREKEAAPLAEEALAAASRSGSPLETCRALLAWAAAHPYRPESLPRLQEARRLAVDLDVADEIARAHIALSQATRRAGLLREEMRVLEEGLRLVEAHGVASYQAVLSYFLLEALIDLGRWDEAADLGRRLERLPVGGIVRAFGAAGRARLAALRGDPEADGAAGEAIELARAIPQQPAPTVLAHLALAEARLWAGEPAEAERHALEALELAAVDPSLAAPATSLAVRAAADLADRARLRGEPMSETTAWVRRVESVPTAGPHITPRVLAHAANARAELSRLTGPGAVEPWREAVTAWERAEDPYAVAYARWRLAQLLLGSRPARSELAQLLRAARESASMLGARPLLAAVNRLTTAAGLDESRADQGTPALTAREREVLRLLAAGRTNAEMADILVISPRTVGVHVSHLLHKLGAARRTEAADLARRAGLLDD